LLPDQPPAAEHEVAFVELQVSVDALPEATDVGLAVSDTVGGGFTVTVTFCESEPPAPEHASVNVLVDASAAEVSLPLVAFAPDHPPEAVQLVALELVQVSVVVAP
jgi:hypothetical protein